VLELDIEKPKAASFEIGRLPLGSIRRADPPQDGHGLPDFLDTGH
jgi:hypothetical protein